MASIAVWEGMNGDQLVAEPDRDAIGWVGFILRPEPDIIYQFTHLGGNPVGINPDVARALAIFARPFPDLPEHLFVQFLQERIIEYIGFALSSKPAARFGNVDLLGFVQFAAQRDIGRDQLFTFLACQWRVGFIILIKQGIGHASSHSLLIGSANIPGHAVQLFACLLFGHRLIFQEHPVRYSPDLVMGFAARAILHDLIKRLIGDECVYQRAIQRFGSFFQRF